ncbi:MAG: Stealth CR1 domain-containing protein [Acutalibacteraceae bacterium]
MENIDFVMIWVDGNDPAWRKEKSLYDGSKDKGDDTEVRYRDWDNLQYWFRGVEKFAPWVHRIHFVTWGHLPPWLNTENPKLHIVNHKDYIPRKYLPTFNSHTIELNLHRIEGLAEQFVYFNDDMFVTASTVPEDFFKNGCPRDTYAQDCIYFGKNSAGPFNGNNMELINSHFDKRQCIRKHFSKWYNPKNGLKRIIKTSVLNIWPWFPGIFYDHLPSNFLKSTFEEVWAAEGEILDKTCMDKFRNPSNCNQWLMKFWQIASGKALPRSMKIGQCFHIKDRNFQELLDALSQGRYKLVCVNDTVNTANFEQQKQQVMEAFEKLLPEKSSFEK